MKSGKPTVKSPEPNILEPLIVLILEPDVRVACFPDKSDVKLFILDCGKLSTVQVVPPPDTVTSPLSPSVTPTVRLPPPKIELPLIVEAVLSTLLACVNEAAELLIAQKLLAALY